MGTYTEAELISIMKTGGVFKMFKAESKSTSPVEIQLSADETTLVVNQKLVSMFYFNSLSFFLFLVFFCFLSSLVPVIDVTEIRFGSKTMSFFKFKRKEEFDENLCFSIMYGIRGVNKVTADGLRFILLLSFLLSFFLSYY